MGCIYAEAVRGVTNAVTLIDISKIDFGSFHRAIIQQLT
jgi:hypothetical protein